MPNPGVTTLSTIRTVAQQQADMVNSQYITTAEWNSYINASYQELYDILVQKLGDNYFVTNDYQFTTNGTSEFYTLPDGSNSYKLSDGVTTAPAFYKLLGVDLWVSSPTQPQQWFTLHRFNFAERNRWTLPSVIAPYGYIAIRYRLNGNQLWLRPLPTANQTIQIKYVPRLTILVNDSDTADLISGWEEYIIIDVVIKAKLKEESDVSGHMARKAELLHRIESAAENRDAGEPQTVIDIYPGGAYGGPGGDHGY